MSRNINSLIAMHCLITCLLVEALQGIFSHNSRNIVRVTFSSLYQRLQIFYFLFVNTC